MNLETLWTIAGVGLILWISMVLLGGIVGIWVLIRFKKHDEEVIRQRQKIDEEIEETRK